jgi:hypothetical protein
VDCDRAELKRLSDQVSSFGTQQSDRNVWGQRPQLLPFESGNQNLLFQAALANELPDVLRNAGVFQFDIQKALGAEFVEDFSQQWDRFSRSGIETSEIVAGHSGDRAAAVSRSIHRIVMDNDETSVAAPANVEFKPGRSGLKRLSE